MGRFDYILYGTNWGQIISYIRNGKGQTYIDNRDRMVVRFTTSYSYPHRCCEVVAAGFGFLHQYTPRYSWNTAKVGVKHQSVNPQPIKLTATIQFLKFVGPIGPRGQKNMRSANNVGNAGFHVRQTFLNDVFTFLTEAGNAGRVVNTGTSSVNSEFVTALIYVIFYLFLVNIIGNCHENKYIWIYCDA